MAEKSMGSFIASLRKERRMTQAELAEKLGVSDKAVSRWERDDSAPDISLLLTIADIFSVTTDELLKGERNNNDEASESGSELNKSKNADNLINYIIFSFLSAFTAFIALLAALDSRLNFLYGRGSFIISIIFYFTAFSIEFISTANACSAVKSKENKKKLFRIVSISLSFIIITALAAIPLIITKTFTVWLKYAVLTACAASLICYIISRTLFNFFIQKGENKNEQVRKNIHRDFRR